LRGGQPGFSWLVSKRLPGSRRFGVPGASFKGGFRVKMHFL
jgi:hypothetical protein